MPPEQSLRSLAAEADLTTREAVERLRAAGIAASNQSRFDGRGLALARKALGLGRAGAGKRLSEDELIVQLLAPLRRKGKVSRMHTTEFTNVWGHGVPPHQKAEARELAERLLADGLLEEKQSVGRRHGWVTQRGLARLEQAAIGAAVPWARSGKRKLAATIRALSERPGRAVAGKTVRCSNRRSRSMSRRRALLGSGSERCRADVAPAERGCSMNPSNTGFSFPPSGHARRAGAAHRAGRQRAFLLAPWLAVSALAVDLPAAAQCELGRLGPVGAPDDFGGYSVAVDAGVAVVGARGVDHLGSFAGTAYVFARSGRSWVQEAELFGVDTTAGDAFGGAVAISGDTIAATSFLDGDNGMNSGSAYVFVRRGGGWVQQAKLVPDDGIAQDTFGRSIAVDGDVVVVGADQHEHHQLNQAGAAYVFERSGTAWSQTAELRAFDEQGGDHFGWSVAVSGDTAVVGSYRDDGPASDSGSAYVFVRSGTFWAPQGRLAAADAAAGDRFGSSVAIDGDTVVVGSPSSNTSDSGSAYVFVRTGPLWQQEAKLELSTVSSFAQLGSSVAIEGDLVLVGAQGQTVGLLPRGAAYTFVRRNGAWSLETELWPSDGTSSARFGVSVSLRGRDIIVGADREGPNGGVAYAFDLACDLEIYCARHSNLIGCPPFLVTSGTPGPSGTAPFTIHGRDMRGARPAVLLYGFRKANLDFHGGKVCVKAPITRLLPFQVAVGASCNGAVSRDFNAHIRSGADPLLTTGQTVTAQWLQVDPQDPTGSGDRLTNAVRFVIGQ